MLKESILNQSDYYSYRSNSKNNANQTGTLETSLLETFIVKVNNQIFLVKPYLNFVKFTYIKQKSLLNS